MARELADLPGDYQSQISNIIAVRRSDLRLALVEATTAISQARLVDFDWQVKVSINS